MRRSAALIRFSSRGPARSRDGLAAGEDDRDAAGDLQRKLLQTAPARDRRAPLRRGDDRQQRGQRRKTRHGECDVSRARHCGHDRFQKFGREVKREAAIADAMLVAAFEAASVIAEQQRPRRQHGRAVRRAVLESALRHGGDAHAVVLLLEGAVVGPGGADHISTRHPGPRARRCEVTPMTRLAIFPKRWRPRPHLRDRPEHTVATPGAIMMRHRPSSLRSIASGGRPSDRADKMSLYGWLIGAWEMDADRPTGRRQPAHRARRNLFRLGARGPRHPGRLDFAGRVLRHDAARLRSQHRCLAHPVERSACGSSTRARSGARAGQ